MPRFTPWKLSVTANGLHTTSCLTATVRYTPSPALARRRRFQPKKQGGFGVLCSAKVGCSALNPASTSNHGITSGPSGPYTTLYLQYTPLSPNQHRLFTTIPMYPLPNPLRRSASRLMRQMACWESKFFGTNCGNLRNISLHLGTTLCT